MLNEMNPIAANLFSMDLEPSVICFKTLSVLVGCFMLWRLRRSPWVPMACWLLIFIYAALAIRWFLWSQNFVHLMELEAANSVPSLRIHHV